MPPPSCPSTTRNTPSGYFPERTRYGVSVGVTNSSCNDLNTDLSGFWRVDFYLFDVKWLASPPGDSTHAFYYFSCGRHSDTSNDNGENKRTTLDTRISLTYDTFHGISDNKGVTESVI